jgi:hypothetical protein
MRSAVCLLCTLVMLAGCSRQVKLSESEMEVGPARSASILGSWVLAHPDETQFVGAQEVELRLEPGTFTLVARYPGAPLLVIDGTASFDPNGGMLTLTPRSSTRQTTAGIAELLPIGKSLTLLANAADNTMVFAQPGDALRTPSSVWHRTAAARRANAGSARLSQRDSVPQP